LLQKPGDLIGVGHSAMFYDKNGDLRIVYHAHYDDKKIHPRKMIIGSVGFKNVDGVEKMFINEQYLSPVLIK
jgi:hypothetical protein